mgnify:FL=1
MAEEPLDWWRGFWAENDRCLYGNLAQPGACSDNWPVRPAFTTKRPRVPVLVELGEDWIIAHMGGRTGVSYRRFIQDFDFQQQVREACAARLKAEIGFSLKSKVDS